MIFGAKIQVFEELAQKDKAIFEFSCQNKASLMNSPNFATFVRKTHNFFFGTKIKLEWKSTLDTTIFWPFLTKTLAKIDFFNQENHEYIF